MISYKTRLSMILLTVMIIISKSSFIFPFESNHNPNLLLSELSEETKGIIASNAVKNVDFSQLSNYSIWLRFHETTSQVEGIMNITYYNADPIVFSSIPFHLFVFGMDFESRAGSIQIQSVKNISNGKESYNFSVDVSNQLLWIDLPTELNQNSTDSFSIHFITTLPDGGIDRCSDSGYDDSQSRIVKFAVAYPMPCVWDEKDGWNLDPYLNIGDPFYTDMGFYKLAVQTPFGFVVAATGALTHNEVNGSEIVRYFDPIYPVREITFSASRYFQVESTMYQETNISTYFLPKESNLWAGIALETAVGAVRLYSYSVGMYPYPSFNVVEEYTHYGGMEHPCQVYITESASLYQDPIRMLRLIIAHETAHQWFYHLVGNDEVDAGFLDEGWACWMEDFYMNTVYPDQGYLTFYKEVTSTRKFNYVYGDYTSQRLNQSVYTAGESYWDLAYDEAPVILEKLRQYLGNDTFFTGLQQFFDSMKFQIAWLNDMQTAFEIAAEKDLSWFFNSWYNNDYLPEYEYENVIYDQINNLLNFSIIDANENLNEYEYVQNISVVFFSNTYEILEIIPITVNGTSHFSLNFNGKIEKLGLYYGELGLAEQSDGEQYKYFNELSIQYI
ncbi:MAG: M1 family metallopeptidase, partial [Promethearchaeota archaeon]